ncbi:MAG: prolyl oligopeptidase family serine peptidase [Prevotellaceae bacterium]|jgi:prolyl oligopeptidase|nr:prolyl oligopeptidase family serine peptidase [Prevotellaceae bacterium]
MKNVKLLAPFLILIAIVASCGEKIVKIDYPETKKLEQKDTYFGTEVADPYRWLEDDNSTETNAWVEAENKITFDYLNKIPFRKQIEDRLTQLWNYPKEGAPYKRGNRWFFSRNEGLQNQYVMYVKDSEDGEARILLDPNKLSDDGTVALAGTSIDNSGKYLAYMISDAGSDWRIAYVMDIETGEKLSDELRWIKFSGLSWYKNGFFYSRYDAPVDGNLLTAKNEFHKVFYHKLGTPQLEDQLIFVDNKNPLRNCNAEVSDDERYLFIYQSQSTDGNILYVKDLEKDSKLMQFNDFFENNFSVIDIIDNKLLIETNYKASNYCVLSVDINKPELANSTVFIPEDPNAVLQGVQYVGGKLFGSYMKDAHSQVRIFDTKGAQQGELKLPTVGTCSGLSGEPDEDVAYFTFTSFTFPSVIYRYEVSKNEYTEYLKPKIDIDLNLYESKQVFYTSKDGTKVPMFIVHKKGLKLDGNNPALLYGYGGFNSSLQPSFSVSRLVWMENGGVYAMANIRGGGEYGKAWHEAGTKMQKQCVFDDFIAAAEYLIQEKYTSSSKLAVQGGSNGGLLIGAVVNQRPDLFGVAIPQVGVMDMLRYHMFTIGWAWAGDYGKSDDSKEQFEYLYKYSPLHNIRSDVDYPATLIMTADHDDRVVPAHSFKYAATLQEAQREHKNPMLIRIQTRAGHGAGTPTKAAIEQQADIYSFILKNMGLTYHITVQK